MASIQRKEGTRFLWGKWSDGHGNVQRGSLETDDPVEAQKRADELERLLRGEDAPAAVPGELTVEGFVGTQEQPGEWLKLRKVSKPLAWRDDLSRLRHHFFATFGKKPLAWLATDDGSRAVFAWAVGLRAHTAQRDGKPLAPRSVWNTYSTAKVLLDDAVELKRLKSSPLASFRPDKYLPAKADKVDGWRESAGFDLDQVVSLTTDARVQPYRRVWNVLAFMVGGARTGELANLRWRDWTETHKGGLGRLVISTAYNSRAKVEKGTKTGAKKLIPVHPFAARVLKAWRDEGWKEWMGREPKPDDFIVPGSDFKQRPNWKLLHEFHADLDALGIGRQRQYENRSTFRNLLLCAGAPEFIVNLMTHPSPKQASDFYTRLEMQWPALCESVLRLDHKSWNAPVSEGTAEGTAAPLPTVSAAQVVHFTREKLEPTPGLEPGTYGLRIRGKTGPEVPGSSLNLPAHSRTFPAPYLRAVPTVPQDSAPLPAVTPELFIEAAAIAAQRAPSDGVALLRRGLEQAAVTSR